MRRYLAPLLVAALLCAYYLVVGCLLWSLPMSRLARLALLLVPLALCGVIIAVLVQRIREIKRGEEDDLDQY